MPAQADQGFTLLGGYDRWSGHCGHADQPRLHGPCHQWTRKKDGKTATRILSGDQLADYQPWFDNHRRLRDLIAGLEALSLGVAARIAARRPAGAAVISFECFRRDAYRRAQYDHDAHVHH
jgi:hypothetical protein